MTAAERAAAQIQMIRTTGTMEEFATIIASEYSELNTVVGKLLMHEYQRDLHPIDFQRVRLALAKVRGA